MMVHLQAAIPPYTSLIRGSLPSTPLRSSTPWASSQHISREVAYFPLMELPAELRIMTARYALHEPDGLAWVWTTYRKVRRVATLRTNGASGGRKTLQDINALARTCKTLYEETRGLILEVSIIEIRPYDMHSVPAPRNWCQSSDESHWFLRAATEALTSLHRLAPLQLRLNIQQVQLHCDYFVNFNYHLTHFKHTVESFRHLQLDFIWPFWQLEALSAFEVQELIEMEEASEPYISEYDQMRQRLETSLATGRDVNDFVSKVNDVERTWRIFPTPMDRHDMAKILGFLTENEQRLVQQWEVDGI